MEELGILSTLPIARFTDNGAYLTLSDGGEVLLPKGYLQGDEREGDDQEVFIYTDSEDRPVAVKERPTALLDEFAFMEAKEVTKFGAFMDWGLLKDLFVPNSEMLTPMTKGKKYLVRVCRDYRTNRLIGVSKYRDFLIEDTRGYEQGQEVKALVFEETELGFKALIEGNFEGLFYRNEVFAPLAIGEEVRAFIKKVREDGKLDLQLTPIGRQKYDEGCERVLQALEKTGFLSLHDKSNPEDIRAELGMSKKHFKQSIGQLYKQNRILIQENGIVLVRED
ncbi:CvfB family protein [Lunatimonas salinarum]|uniref:CvfB family protein n=1 Tax=Lunatimonas salinarum TaxID=1774590 RepID=UPI001ADFDE0D|nr:S1-like domain-containing RNA-binding protein [Lunatimonas salinarum]